MEEITDMKYDYEHMNLFDSINCQTFLQSYFSKPFVLEFQFSKKLLGRRPVTYTFYITTTSEYLNFIEKIYNKSEIICHLCKSISKYYCPYCQDFFCSLCFENHVKKCEKYKYFVAKQPYAIIESVSSNDYKNKINKIQKRNSKFLINNFPMDWKRCSCNENKKIIYC